MLMNQNLGAPVVWTIGARGERPDEWPARIVTPVQHGQDDRGNPGLVATIITEQTNLRGEKFYGERTVQTRYLFDRAERVESLDGTVEKPITPRELIALRQQSVKGYLAARGAGTNVGDLMAAAAASLNGQSVASDTTAMAESASTQVATPTAIVDGPPEKPAKK